MSMLLMVQAMKTKVGNPLRKLVLIKLADNASDQGECWPSHRYIADQCEISKRSVINHIKALERDGLIKIENRIGERGKRSNLYHLTLDRVQEMHMGSAGDAYGGSAGDAYRISHSLEPVKESYSESRFEEFWGIYAKKTGKETCQKKFKKLSASDIKKIFEVLPAYIKSTPDVQYRKNPATWLNQKCWNDELLTEKPKPKSERQEFPMIDEEAMIRERFRNG